MGGEDRDREGKAFGEYMDATQDGTAYVGPGGNWVSARDTWCNSHRKPDQRRLGRRESTSEEDSHEIIEVIEEGAEEGVEADFDEDSDEEGTGDDFEEGSDAEFVNAE